MIPDLKKKMPGWLILFVLAVTSLIISCTPTVEDPVYNLCLVTKVYTQGDTSQTATNYAYNNDDLLVLVNSPGPFDNTISYEPGKVLIRGVPPYTNYYTTYYIGNDSLAFSSAQYLNGGLLDSTLYYYDADKHLVKSVRFTQAFGKDSVMMTWAGSDMTHIVIYNSNGTAPQATFTYGGQISKSWIYQNVGPFNNNGAYYPWLGKSSVHLISSYQSEFNGNPQPINITYVINASGYVDELTFQYTGGADKNYFEYKCR